MKTCSRLKSYMHDMKVNMPWCSVHSDTANTKLVEDTVTMYFNVMFEVLIAEARVVHIKTNIEGSKWRVIHGDYYFNVDFVACYDKNDIYTGHKVVTYRVRPICLEEG